MIRPAILYADELNGLFAEIQYDLEYQWFYGGTQRTFEDISESEDDKYARQFCSVVNDKVCGYFYYCFCDDCNYAFNLGMISFDKGNMEVIKDFKNIFYDMFRKYHLSKITWSCYADAPVYEMYSNLIKKYDGIECGHFHNHVKLLDGKAHDLIHFEIFNKGQFDDK